MFQTEAGSVRSRRVGDIRQHFEIPGGGSEVIRPALNVQQYTRKYAGNTIWNCSAGAQSSRSARSGCSTERTRSAIQPPGPWSAGKSLAGRSRQNSNHRRAAQRLRPWDQALAAPRRYPRSSIISFCRRRASRYHSPNSSHNPDRA